MLFFYHLVQCQYKHQLVTPKMHYKYFVKLDILVRDSVCVCVCLCMYVCIQIQIQIQISISISISIYLYLSIYIYIYIYIYIQSLFLTFFMETLWIPLKWEYISKILLLIRLLGNQHNLCFENNNKMAAPFKSRNTRYFNFKVVSARARRSKTSLQSIHYGQRASLFQFSNHNDNT